MRRWVAVAAVGRVSTGAAELRMKVLLLGMRMLLLLLCQAAHSSISSSSICGRSNGREQAEAGARMRAAQHSTHHSAPPAHPPQGPPTHGPHRCRAAAISWPVRHWQPFVACLPAPSPPAACLWRQVVADVTHLRNPVLDNHRQLPAQLDHLRSRAGRGRASRHWR